jgi:hypothetical protein
MPFVRADAVEEAAWRALETFLISPQIIFDQVGSPGHQIALLEKELQGVEQERGELVKRQSRLLDLYERADRTLLEELDTRMARNKAAQADLDLTFRTFFRTAEAIFAEPFVERGAGARYRLCHAL